LRNESLPRHYGREPRLAYAETGTGSPRIAFGERLRGRGEKKARLKKWA